MYEHPDGRAFMKFWIFRQSFERKNKLRIRRTTVKIQPNAQKQLYEFNATILAGVDSNAVENESAIIEGNPRKHAPK